MEDKMKILFIDDDVVYSQVIVLALQENGYEVIYQNSLSGAKACMKESHPNLILLDVEIGKSNGIEVIPTLKAIAPETPIIVISSHTEDDTMAAAYETGAENYLTKPVSIKVLLACIRRFAAPHAYQIAIGKLLLDTDSRKLLMQNAQLIKQLSESEYKLLKLLVAYPNQIIHRQQIEKELWEDESGNEQSLNNFVSKLRKYLAADSQIELITIQKEGYKLIINE